MTERNTCVIFGFRVIIGVAFPFSAPAFTLRIKDNKWSDINYFKDPIKLPEETPNHCTPTGFILDQEPYIISRDRDSKIYLRNILKKDSPVTYLGITSTETVVAYQVDPLNKLNFLVFHKDKNELFLSVFEGNNNTFRQVGNTHSVVKKMNDYPSLPRSYEDNREYGNRLFFANRLEDGTSELASIKIHSSGLAIGEALCYNRAIAYSPSAIEWRIQNQRFYVVFYQGVNKTTGEFTRELKCIKTDINGSILGHEEIQPSTSYPELRIRISTSPSVVYRESLSEISVFYIDHDTQQIKEAIIQFSTTEFRLKNIHNVTKSDSSQLLLGANCAPFAMQLS